LHGHINLVVDEDSGPWRTVMAIQSRLKTPMRWIGWNQGWRGMAAMEVEWSVALVGAASVAGIQWFSFLVCDN
jgi:hypothetical protein